MTVRLEELSVPLVWHVVKNMRQSDWQEIINLLPKAQCTVDGITMFVMHSTHVGFVLTVDDVPACVVQFSQRHEGCWSAGMFATDDFRKCWRRVVTECRELAIPSIIESEGRYCEAHVMVDNADAQKFLEWAGWSRKCLLTNYGSFGKDFYLYTVTLGEIARVFDQNRSPRRGRTD